MGPRDRRYNQVVSRVREVAKRILGAGRPNRKEPLSVEVLKEIVEGADLSNVLQLTLKNLFSDRLSTPSRPTNWFKLISISRVQPSGVS